MSKKNITLNERILIERYLDEAHSITSIGKLLKRDTSTMSREIKRNSFYQRHYFAWYAEIKSFLRKKNSIHPYKSNSTRLKIKIQYYLKKGFNPNVICNRLKLEKRTIGVCPETIYQIVYNDYRDGGSLYKLMPLARKRRKRISYKPDKRGKIENFRHISEREDFINSLQRKYHWEMDTITGNHHKGNLLSLIERKSKYIEVQKLKNKKAEEVKLKIQSISAKHKIYTMTTDQGREFSLFKEIEKENSLKIYFCDKASPWQKGMIENANRIIRRHLPKGIPLGKLSQKNIDKAIKKINNIPRKSLNYKTPYEVYWNLPVLRY